MGAARRVKVGIFFNARRGQGGLYQYALTLVDCLGRFVPEFDYSLYHATMEELPLELTGSNWRLIRLPRRAIQARLVPEAVLMTAARVGIRIPFPLVSEFSEIKGDHPEAMIYVKPGVHPFQWKYKAIFPIHDLQHRLQPQFPEVSKHGEYQRREYIYTRSTRNASVILTDSETGKEDVINCYSVPEERIFPVPYIAPTFRKNGEEIMSSQSIVRKYSLPAQFLFYPAAFWEHKNHTRLIRAISLLAREKNIRIHLVLAGSKRAGYQNLADLVDSLGLGDLVHFIGYVPDDDMPDLYRLARALVMPTFFGPTNIPVLEAWSMECAVITSDLRGIREQVGDAGLLVDPKSEHSIAEAILLLDRSPELRQRLVERGRLRAQEWTPQKFAGRVADAIRYALAQPLQS